MRTYLVTRREGALAIVGESSDRRALEDLQGESRVDGLILTEKELGEFGMAPALAAWSQRTDRRYSVRDSIVTTSERSYVVCTLDPEAAAVWEGDVGATITEADAKLAYPDEMDAWMRGDDDVAEADLDLSDLELRLESVEVDHFRSMDLPDFLAHNASQAEPLPESLARLWWSLGNESK